MNPKCEAAEQCWCPCTGNHHALANVHPRQFVQMHNLFVQFAKLLDKTDKPTSPTNKHMGTMH